MSSYALVVVISAVAGLAVGSFLNVVIHRVPLRISVSKPRSRCPRCQVAVAPRDNIPLISWLVLRGRCRSCSEPISWRYPMVEALTAGLFVLMVARFGVDPAVPAFCVLMAFLLAVSAIDIEHFIVPNRLVYPTLVLTVGLLVAAAAAGGKWEWLGRAALGGVIGFVALGTIHVIQPRGMGFGDVRMAGMVGIYLGWLGLADVLVGLFLAFLTAGVIGAALVVFAGKGAKTKVPFAPFLALGTFLTVIWGRQIVHFWLG